MITTTLYKTAISVFKPQQWLIVEHKR